jgi:hypothetical protein
MPPLRKVRSLVLLSLMALAGCETAHVVSKDAYGGVVAIPQKSNSWPFYHYDKALALIKKECPDYEILSEGQVVTGQMTTNRDSTETQNRDLTPKGSRWGATATTTDTTQTTEVRNRTEYRITYRRKGAPPMVGMPPGMQPPLPPLQQAQYVTPNSAWARPTPLPGQSGLPPEPTPIAVGGR